MHEKQGCRVTFKNTEKQISIELTYTKRDKDVDIRDFLCKIISNDKLEVQFKKGHYELNGRGGHEDVLNRVPDVIRMFHKFYKESFGESAGRNEDTSTSTSENVPYVNERSKREAQVTSENSSGHSDRGPAFGHDRPETEEATQGDNKNVDTLISANRDHHADEDETAPRVQNSKDGRKPDIETPGTTHGGAHHGDPKEGNKGPNPKSESGDEHKEKEKQKSDSAGRKKEKDNNDEEDKKYKNEHKEKEKQKSDSAGRKEEKDNNDEEDKKYKNEHKEKEKQKSDSAGRKEEKDNNDEEDKKYKNEHKEKEKQKSDSAGKKEEKDNNDEEDKKYKNEHKEKEKQKSDSAGRKEEKDNNDEEDKKYKNEHKEKEKQKSDSAGRKEEKENTDEEDKKYKNERKDALEDVQKNPNSTQDKKPKHDEEHRERSDSSARDKTKGSEHGEQKPRKNASQVDGVDDEAGSHGSNYGATGITQGGRERSGSNGKEKTKSSEHGEQKPRKNASQVDNVDDEAGSHGSNYGATGITQGGRERSGSNGKEKTKSSEHGEQNLRKNASQVDNVDDEADSHGSNYGATGMPQGGRGHDGSERSKVNSTMSNTMHKKNKHD